MSTPDTVTEAEPGGGPEPDPPTDASKAQEPMPSDDVNLKRIGWTGAALVATVAAIVVGVLGWRGASSSQPHAAQPMAMRAPAPTLQTDPLVDRVHEQDPERRRLATYGWIDRDAGVVRVPVERAMELVARPAAASETAR